MAFDGLPKPAQYSPTGPLNPYLADNAARLENSRTPRVKKTVRDEDVTHVHHELPQYGDDEEKEQEQMSEEEYEQLMLFAKLRGMMHIALEKGERYQFIVNPQTGLVDVVAASSKTVVMSLTPVELMEMSQRIHRYAGVLTDHNG